MTYETELARAIARVLLSYADRKDGIDRKDTAEDEYAAEEEDLPPISDMATSQHAVLAALATTPRKGMTAREIADRTDVTQFNVYEKLDRLEEMGYVEQVPDSTPKRWRWTPRAWELADSDDAAPSDYRVLIEKMDKVAGELGLTVRSGPTGRNYEPPVLESGVKWKSGIGVWSSARGAEFNLSVFRDLGANEVADDLLQRLREVTGIQVNARAWPAVPCQALIANWDRARSQLILPYFEARRELAGEDRQTGT
jgi:DNA-binding MarR family transcriptional regulator